MNEELKDKGLKKALKEQPALKLPSNFAYQTMQKIEATLLLHEKRIERRTLWTTIVAATCLMGCSIAGLTIYFGESIREAFTRIYSINVVTIQVPPFYYILILTVPLFFLFDRWMRKQYFKRHKA